MVGELTPRGVARALVPLPIEEQRLEAVLRPFLTERLLRGWVRALTTDWEPPEPAVAALVDGLLRGVGRPVVLAVRDRSVALDDLVERLRDRPAPVVLVSVGLEDNPLGPEEQAVALGPLAPAERRWLVQQLLPADEALAARLSEGRDYPGPLRDAIVAEVERGLAAGPEGFVGVEASVEPDEPMVRWIAGRSDAARTASTVAALLGPRSARRSGVRLASGWARPRPGPIWTRRCGSDGRGSPAPGSRCSRRSPRRCSPPSRSSTGCGSRWRAPSPNPQRAALLLDEARHPDAPEALIRAAGALHDRGGLRQASTLREAAAAAFERTGDRERAAYERSWVLFYQQPTGLGRGRGPGRGSPPRGLAAGGGFGAARRRDRGGQRRRPAA